MRLNLPAVTCRKCARYRSSRDNISKQSDTGYWMLDTGYWILDTGYWILDTGYWIKDRFFDASMHQFSIQFPECDCVAAQGSRHKAKKYSVRHAPSIQYPASSIQHPVSSIQ
jgi:hypothetical protein